MQYDINIRIIKCTRCGKEIVSSDKNEETDFTRVTCFTDEKYQSFRSFDLCPECYSELLKWLRNEVN